MTFFKSKAPGQKFIGLFVIAAMLSPLQSFADYKVIYQDVQKTDLSSGVRYEQHLKLTNGGWININVMRVDLTNPNVDIKPIYPDAGLSKKEKLTTLASKQKNLIGAVNADFFDIKKGTTIGQIIENGNLVTTGSTSKGGPPTVMASLNISKDNLAFVEYWKDYAITLSNPKINLPIAFKNKPYFDYSWSVIFDQSWAKQSYGNTLKKPIIEMLIVDNYVVNIVENGPPMDIPAYGYVVSSVGSTIETVRNNFAIGDPVVLDYSTDLKNLDFSIGGGSLMVKEGKVVAKYTTNIPGSNPRTAVGISKDKKELIIMTIDGRTNNFRGVNQPELATILIELGAYEAINLDGGGSTEMLVKTLGQTTPKIINNPSDGGERRVHNGIGVFSTSESGALDQLILQMGSTKMMIQSPLNLSLTGVDANRNTVVLDPALIKWSVSNDSGTVINNQFIPTKVGKSTLTAVYNDKTISKEVDVYKDIVNLDIQTNLIQLKSGESTKLDLIGYTANGYTIPISATSVIWTIPNNLISILPDGTVTAGTRAGKGVLIASIDGVKKYIPIIVGADMTLLDDFNQPNGAITSIPEIVTASYNIIGGSKDGTMAGQILYDFTNSDQTRAVYLNMNNGGTVINTLPDKIGLDVFGTFGNNHWLRAKVVDAKGKSVILDIAKNINWTDWKYVEATIPRDLVAPIKVAQIYMVEDDPVKRDSGYILVDNLFAVNEKKNDVVVPKDTDKLPKIENMKIKTTAGTNIAVYGEFNGTETLVNDENYKAVAATLNKYKYTYFAGTADEKMSKLLPCDVQASSYTEKAVDQTLIVTMKSINNSFIKADPLQWEKFLARVKGFKYKNLVLVTNHNMNFSDKLEEKLFAEQLEKLNAAGVKTYVLSGGQSNGYDVRLKNNATIIDLQTLNKYSGFDLSKQAAVLTMNLSGNTIEFQVKPLNFIVKKPTTSKLVKAPSSIFFKKIRTASPIK